MNANKPVAPAAFPSGNLARVTSLAGGRIIVLVGDNGYDYFETLDSNRVPYVLDMALEPENIGTVFSLSQRIKRDMPEILDDFMACWEDLTRRRLDELSIARGLFWAVEQSYLQGNPRDNVGEKVMFDTVAEQAELATAEVKRLRDEVSGKVFAS